MDKASKFVKQLRENLFKKGFCVSSLEQLRERFPRSAINQKSVFEQVPDLTNVSDTIKHYQRQKDFFTSEYYLRTYNRADYRGAPMPLRLFTWRFLRALRKRGIPMYVHTCFRSTEDQRKLKLGGFSNLNDGPHQRSAAVDIVHAVDHWDPPEEFWYYIGTLGEAIARDMALGPELGADKPLKIEWGGRWSKPFDPAHFQLSDWKHRPKTNKEETLKLPPYSDKMRFG